MIKAGASGGIIREQVEPGWIDRLCGIILGFVIVATLVDP